MAPSLRSSVTVVALLFVLTLVFLSSVRTSRPATHTASWLLRSTGKLAFVLRLAEESFDNSAWEIPQYVLDYAPLVYLSDDEDYWPGDISEHFEHVTSYLNYTPITPDSLPLTMANLNQLNHWSGGKSVYLQSNDDVEKLPDWLTGVDNIPSREGIASPRADPLSRAYPPPPTLPPSKQRPRSHDDAHPNSIGYSKAPAILVMVPKDDGIVDAFWFFFYSYNLGNMVLGIRFGDHVGDWEHTLVRFQHGKPTHVFVSEHFFGQAYTYDAIEKIGDRPVVYSATGTHAMYATPGVHSYILPLGLLHDNTDRGPIWDPRLNSHRYRYSLTTSTLYPEKSSGEGAAAATGWFHFTGRWGDKMYPPNDPRQYQFAGNSHYVSGPTGPKFKNLARVNVCQDDAKECEIRQKLGVLFEDGREERPPVVVPEDVAAREFAYDEL
ncbi:MAG: Vacuolar protein sorting-associated protein 62 [Thelocarpon superellum]|nr:MAG: Vacuolar protein sorting-associated protein 62 [Thelocarpon superellum]